MLFIKNISYLVIVVIYDIIFYCVNYINGSYLKKYFYKFWIVECNGIKIILFILNLWFKYMYRYENLMVFFCISLVLWVILVKSYVVELLEINCCMEVIIYILLKIFSCIYV